MCRSSIRRLGCVLLLAVSFVPLHAADDAVKPIPGSGPTGKISKLHTGFKFTEGPAADNEGNLFFSDIPNERIHKLNSKGELSVFREKSDKAMVELIQG